MRGSCPKSCGVRMVPGEDWCWVGLTLFWREIVEARLGWWRPGWWTRPGPPSLQLVQSERDWRAGRTRLSPGWCENKTRTQHPPWPASLLSASSPDLWRALPFCRLINSRISSAEWEVMFSVRTSQRLNYYCGEKSVCWGTALIKWNLVTAVLEYIYITVGYITSHYVCHENRAYCSPIKCWAHCSG